MIHFWVTQTTDGWHARVRGNNGEVVWWTEEYHDRRDAEHAVELIVGLLTAERVVSYEHLERSTTWTLA